MPSLRIISSLDLELSRCAAIVKGYRPFIPFVTDDGFDFVTTIMANDDDFAEALTVVLQ